MAFVRVAIAQINLLVGAPKANAARLLQAAQVAYDQGAQVLVGPELLLPGYPPEDLLLRAAFLDLQDAALLQLQAELAAFPGLHVLVGHAQRVGAALYNAATVVVDGHRLLDYHKRELPNYAVFDERRYFNSQQVPQVFEINGVCLGVNICEDIWFDAAPKAAAGAGAQVLLVPNASPFHAGKQAEREAVARAAVAASGCAVVYVNSVGGQDELVFDGGSMALDRTGRVAARLPAFEESIALIDVDDQGNVVPLLARADCPVLSMPAQAYQALVLGTRDYVRKNGFKGALLGLSGGIDSALVLAVAVDALGAQNVCAVMMPSRYTADISQTDAARIATRLGVRYERLAIDSITDAVEAVLAPQFAGMAPDVTEENIQARSRGLLLMALSNKTGRLVLTTGNKSEMATGYCTLYGDMAGSFAVLKDVPKTLVYRLANWRNRDGEVIPERIMTRAPSAELRDDQTDQDSLPPYDVLDAIIERYVEHDAPSDDIIAAGYAPAVVAQVISLLRMNEYKRRQAPPGPRITTRAFGRDWRYPVTNGFKETF